MVQLANYRISFTSFPPHRNSNNCKLCNYLEHCKLSERYEITGNNIIGGNYIAKFLEELQLGEGGGGGGKNSFMFGIEFRKKGTFKFVFNSLLN